MDNIKWENAVTIIPVNANITETLNKAGEDGWEPWAILGSDGQMVQIALKRHKRLVNIVSDIPQGLIGK